MSAAGVDPRAMWEAVERYHQLCYWAPEVSETATEAGLKGLWMNYLATRAAPLGEASAAARRVAVLLLRPSQSPAGNP